MMLGWCGGRRPPKEPLTTVKILCLIFATSFGFEASDGYPTVFFPTYASWTCCYLLEEASIIIKKSYKYRVSKVKCVLWCHCGEVCALTAIQANKPGSYPAVIYSFYLRVEAQWGGQRQNVGKEKTEDKKSREIVCVCVCVCVLERERGRERVCI